jgi:hypothetical protein
VASELRALVRGPLGPPAVKEERQAHGRKNPRADEPEEKLIKIGGKVISHGRYVAFQMAEVAIPRILFADILRLIAELLLPPVTSTA